MKWIGALVQGWLKIDNFVFVSVKKQAEAKHSYQSCNSCGSKLNNSSCVKYSLIYVMDVSWSKTKKKNRAYEPPFWIIFCGKPFRFEMLRRYRSVTIHQRNSPVLGITNIQGQNLNFSRNKKRLSLN